jgi:hypothetical protein
MISADRFQPLWKSSPLIEGGKKERKKKKSLLKILTFNKEKIRFYQ